jgi:hypothetical protein
MCQDHTACATAVKVSLNLSWLTGKRECDWPLSTRMAGKAGDAGGEKISQYYFAAPANQTHRKFLALEEIALKRNRSSSGDPSSFILSGIDR